MQGGQRPGQRTAATGTGGHPWAGACGRAAPRRSARTHRCAAHHAAGGAGRHARSGSVRHAVRRFHHVSMRAGSCYCRPFRLVPGSCPRANDAESAGPSCGAERYRQISDRNGPMMRIYMDFRPSAGHRPRPPSSRPRGGGGRIRPCRRPPGGPVMRRRSRPTPRRSRRWRRRRGRCPGACRRRPGLPGRRCAQRACTPRERTLLPVVDLPARQ
jgi:hypothetical protein